jgi:hypothetical protein
MEGTDMPIIIAVLLLAVLLAGLGFAVHLLWWIALVVIVLWLLGFVLRGAELPPGTARPRGAGRPRGWYRW